MRILDWLTKVETKAQAYRLTAIYGVFATIVASTANAALATLTAQSVPVTTATTALIAAILAPAMTWPLATAALALSAREHLFAVQANTDSLTGALNRRGFFAAAQAILDQPGARPLCVVLVDLDHFKAINDSHGHAAGDEAVIAAARAIAHVAAPYRGLVGRIGGDEFSIMLPDIDASRAAILAERLRGEIQLRIVRRPDRFIRVTASIGVAMRQSDDVVLDDLIARADAALYAAKSQGRNRAVVDLREARLRRA